MDIKTKYDPLQKVFFVDHNGINSGAIGLMSVTIVSLPIKPSIKVMYRVAGVLRDETDLFPDRQSLLHYLCTMATVNADNPILDDEIPF